METNYLVFDRNGESHKLSITTTPVNMNLDKFMEQVNKQFHFIVGKDYWVFSDTKGSEVHVKRIYSMQYKARFFPFVGGENNLVFKPASNADQYARVQDCVEPVDGLPIFFNLPTYVAWVKGGSSYMFTLKGRKTYRPPICNVFEDGRMCFGNNYSESYESPELPAKRYWNDFNSMKVNADLCSPGSSKFLIFDDKDRHTPDLSYAENLNLLSIAKIDKFVVDTILAEDLSAPDLED